ncbi:MAG: GDYXXLXY domain-containing protein [Alphaproteobacteria bacterium]|nr:GDYXXLXY domain-containing protein [Alphaproteobacteria bacterium]
MKKYLNFGMALVIIAVFIYGIMQKETLIAEGDVVYLALAPVDPRSIMQGDYMRLRYAIERQGIGFDDMPKARAGFLRLKLDDERKAEFVGFDEGQALGAGEVLFKYSKVRSGINLQPDSFLFQEGLRTTYAVAKYGIFKVSGDEHLLVGLADGDLVKIDPSAPSSD